MLLCACLFFGSSAKLFFANATSGSINSVSQNFELYNNNGTLTLQVQASACSPYITQFESVAYAYNSIIGSPNSAGNQSNTGSFNQVYQLYAQQDFIYMFRLANNTNEDLFINTGYLSALISTAENATSNPDPDWWGCYYEILGGNLFDTITSVSSSGTVQYRWSSPFTYNSGLVIPAKSVLYSQIVQHLYYAYDSIGMTGGSVSGPYDADKFARKINTITLGNPTSSQVSTITNFTLMNADYNSIEEVEKLNSIYGQLVTLYNMELSKLGNIQSITNALQLQNHTDLNQIHNDLQSLINKDTEINSNIVDQTEQQEQQYNEFSSHVDSSDNAAISSTISSGTNAVKERIGLFSFFDGIVNDMSDLVASDHQRELVLPALDIPLPEETVHIWDRREFNFDELENNFSGILTVVRFATVAICYSAIIKGSLSIFHKFIGVKDSDA